MKEYIVIRSHIGDKPYQIGDTRKTARPNELAHLVGRCLALPGSPEAKAALEQAKTPKKKPAPNKAKKKAATAKKQNPSTAKKGSGSGRRKSPATKKPKTQAQKDRANELARKRRAAKKSAVKA